MKLLKRLFNKLKPKTEQERITEYLAKSTDLVDLERRQKKLIYGNMNPNLRGWV